MNDSKGVLIFYNISNAKTLEDVPFWVQTIKKNAKDIPIILVGNNCDRDKPRDISREEGVELTKELGLAGYTEISTINGEGIEPLFEALLEKIFKRYGIKY